MPKISDEGVLTINIVWCKSKYRRVPCHVAPHLHQGSVGRRGSVDSRGSVDDVNLSSRKDLTSGSEFMTLKNFEKQEELRN